MVEKSLASKLKLKPGSRALLLSAPLGYLEQLDPLPAGVQIHTKPEGLFDWVQIFVKNKAELDAGAPSAIKSLKPDGLLWISYPKGSSKIQTDLTRDKGWDTMNAAGLKFLTLVSVNDQWSAFAFRPYKPGETRQSFRLGS